MIEHACMSTKSGGNMSWLIQCSNSSCKKNTHAANIVELLAKHRDGRDHFRCACGKPGYIKRQFNLQEPGETWQPYLRDAISLGEPGDTYQPFVFLVSYEPDGAIRDVWFSYYKDMRSAGGKLKLGHGPGGPPVLSVEQLGNSTKNLNAMGKS